METKALKKQLGAAIAMVLVAAIALGAATFAWFVNNNAVKAEGVDVSTSSSVPNLYITSTGKTTDGMTAAGTITRPSCSLFPPMTLMRSMKLCIGRLVLVIMLLLMSIKTHSSMRRVKPFTLITPSILV